MSKPHAATRKAAILVASLDRQTADAFLERLPEPVAASIRDQILSLSSHELAGEAEVIHEFLADPPANLAELGDDSARFESTLTDDQPVSKNSTPPRPIDSGVSLHQASPLAIAKQLRTERPQTIALAISKLPPDKAAQVLVQLTRSQQTLVIDRLVELRVGTTAGAADDVCDEIESALNRQIPTANDTSFCRELLCQLIGETEGSAREHFLKKAKKLDVVPASIQGFEAGDRVLDVAEVVEAGEATIQASRPADSGSSAIVFDDLVHLDNAVLAAVLQRCDASDLLIALRGADREFLRRLQSCLPPREADELEQRVSQLGAVRLADVQASQLRLATAAAEIASAPVTALD